MCCVSFRGIDWCTWQFKALLQFDVFSVRTMSLAHKSIYLNCFLQLFDPAVRDCGAECGTEGGGNGLEGFGLISLFHPLSYSEVGRLKSEGLLTKLALEAGDARSIDC